MPRLDQTGPQGMGPRTGRGMGPCGVGQGMGGGVGRMQGGFCPCPDVGYTGKIKKEDEKEMLEDELKAMEEGKKEIEKRLGELNG